MTNELIAAVLAGIGALIGAAIQYRFQRLSADRLEQREIIETHFLQMQDALESLYYRINNLRDWGGQRVMSDDYFKYTSVYAIGRVLAHESLLVAKGIYAKLHYNETLKRKLKTSLHRINRGLDDRRFLHYYRQQLAESLIEGGGVLTYTRFLSRKDDAVMQPAIAAAIVYIETAAPESLDQVRAAAQEAIALLEAHTKVPSALSLVQSLTGRKPPS